MQPIYTTQGTSSRPPTLGGLLMLVGFVLIGGVVSTLILFVLMAVGKGMDFAQAQTYLAGLAAHPAASAGSWYELMALQAVNHLGTFLVPSLAYWFLIERKRWSQFNQQSLGHVTGLSLVVLSVIAFMPFDGLIIEWNQNLHLPETLAPIEQWIRDKEKGLEGLTQYLTTFTTTGQLVVALLVIGIIPAIGEETLFRGILQRNLSYWTGNVHVGIWLGAALFSAIHVQFLGFFPRMLLGALFGYLYVWSGNLWVPVLAHFINNGFTVLMVYLHQQKVTTLNIEDTDSVPLFGALFSGACTLVVLYYFRKNNEGKALG